MKERLLELIKKIAYEKKRVILSSGKESDFYIDLRNITLHPEGLYLVSNLFYEAIQKNFPDVKAIGGPTLGADPIVAGVSLISHMKNNPLTAFIIRREPKKYGLAKLIEGDKNLYKGMKALILEDVVTTGESSFKAYNNAKEFGLDVEGIMAIVDREDGASDFFRKQNIKFYSLFTKKDITGE
ncbi:MAG: orotate phosphoribosyltransferase [Proteobacteria bacterium]|nr:orotate phosphoribosyltransferase [Pseudomonadota bacterium]